MPVAVTCGCRWIPRLKWANTNFRSSLFVVNPNDLAAEVTLIAREGSAHNGVITAASPKQIPANGLVVIENLFQELGASSSFGAVEIRCALPVIAVSRVYNPDGNASGFLEAKHCNKAESTAKRMSTLDALRPDGRT